MSWMYVLGAVLSVALLVKRLPILGAFRLVG